MPKRISMPPKNPSIWWKRRIEDRRRGTSQKIDGIICLAMQSEQEWTTYVIPEEEKEDTLPLMEQLSKDYGEFYRVSRAKCEKTTCTQACNTCVGCRTLIVKWKMK